LYSFDIKVMPGPRKKNLRFAIKEAVLVSSGKGWGKGNTQFYGLYPNLPTVITY